MNNQWKHPGMRSSDYSHSNDHDHDKRNFSGIGPKGYKRKDESVKDEASELLCWSPEVDASEIELNVQNGVISLSGFVDSRHAKRLAEDLLEKIIGVKDIDNRLIIKKDLDMEEDKIIARGDDGLYSQEIIQK
jgi:osmotically-inducible protein OsmY